MTREDIIRMAREAGVALGKEVTNYEYSVIHRFAALVAAAERNKLAQWMVDHSYATGHGDTAEDLLEELDWQITESWSKVVMASVEAEREACAGLVEDWDSDGPDPRDIAAAIRARGQA